MPSSTTHQQDSSISPIYIFDNPRTYSQLFHSYLKGHPQLVTTDPGVFHWATNATIAGPNRIQLKLRRSDHATEADRSMQEQFKVVQEYMPYLNLETETQEVALARMTASISKIQQDGKVPLMKDHISAVIKEPVILELLRKGSVEQVPANPTILPDELFFSIRRPLILIRHPAQSIPSYWRAQQNNFSNDIGDELIDFWTMQRLNRLLFDSLRHADPIVVDGEDVVSKPEELCNKICQTWQIDPAGIRFEWEEVPFAENPHPLRDFRTTIDHSRGIVHKTKGVLNIDTEQAKWEQEFGAEIARALRKKVDDNLADYEYLQTFRLRV